MNRIILTVTLTLGLLLSISLNHPETSNAAPAPNSTSPGNGLTVYNKGVSGQNSKGGRARFEKDVVRLKPQFVFIYFGLNDALNERAFQTREQFIANLSWMVDAARKSNIKPVLCTIHHVTEAPLYQRHKKEIYGSEGPNGKIDRYNAAIRALAKEKKVKLSDFNAVMDREEKAGKTVISRDGVHLPPAGYTLLARCFLDTVRGELKGKETIVCLGDSVTFGAGVKGAGTVTGDTYPATLARLPLGKKLRNDTWN